MNLETGVVKDGFLVLYGDQFASLERGEDVGLEKVKAGADSVHVLVIPRHRYPQWVVSDKSDGTEILPVASTASKPKKYIISINPGGWVTLRRKLYRSRRPGSPFMFMQLNNEDGALVGASWSDEWIPVNRNL